MFIGIFSIRNYKFTIVEFLILERWHMSVSTIKLAIESWPLRELLFERWLRRELAIELFEFVIKKTDFGEGLPLRDSI
jgi:hypothetical protein